MDELRFSDGLGPYRRKKRWYLSRLQYEVLVSVQLNQGASTPELQTGRSHAPASVYGALRVLQNEGYVTSTEGAMPKFGRATLLWSITQKGNALLSVYQNAEEEYDALVKVPTEANNPLYKNYQRKRHAKRISKDVRKVLGDECADALDDLSGANRQETKEVCAPADWSAEAYPLSDPWAGFSEEGGK